MMNTATTTTRLMATVATKTRAGRRVSTSPPRASRAGGPAGSVPVTARTRAAAAATPAGATPGAATPGAATRRGDSGRGTQGLPGRRRRQTTTVTTVTGRRRLRHRRVRHRRLRPAGRQRRRARRAQRPAAQGARRTRPACSAWPPGPRRGHLARRRHIGRGLLGLGCLRPAADRGNPPLESDPLRPADSRPTGRPGGQESSDDLRAAAGPRPGADPRRRRRPAVRGRAARRDRPPRPPAGLRGDYQPGGAQLGPPGNRAAGSRAGQARADGGYAPSGGARPGNRAAGGPAGHRADQRLVKPGRVRAVGRPGPPAVLPARQRPGRKPASRRQRPADRGADWGERTERIDRVNASGYPEPRGNSRSQGPGRPGPSGTSGPFGAAAAPGAAGRGRSTAAAGDNGRVDNGRPTAAADGGGPTARTGEHRTAGQRAATPTANPAATAAAGPGRPRRPPRRRPGRRPPWRRRPAHQQRVLARSGERRRRPFLPGGRAPFAGPGEADRADAGLHRADRLPVRRVPHRAVRDRRHRRVPGPAVRHRGARRARRRARGQYQTGATGEYPAAQHRANGVSGVNGKSAADQYRTGEYQTGDYRSDDYQTGEYGQYRADPQPSDARYPGYAGSQPGPSGQPAPRPAPASRSSRVGADSRARSAPAGRTQRADRTDSAGSRSATRAGPACRTPSGALRPVPGAAAAASAAAPAVPATAVSGAAVQGHCLRHRSPSHRASPSSRNSRARAARAGTARAAAARPAAQRAGRCPPAPGGTPTSQRSRVPIPIPASLTRPARGRPATGRATRTRPWTDATDATDVTHTADVPAGQPPADGYDPADGTTAPTATAPRATAATDPFHRKCGRTRKFHDPAQRLMHRCTSR